MAPLLEYLPSEILDRIAQFIRSTIDLKSLRMSCKRERKKYNEVLCRPGFNAFVRNVTLYTFENHDFIIPYDGRWDSCHAGKLGEDYVQEVSAVGAFPNLSAVQLKYTRECSANHVGPLRYKIIPEPLGLRAKVFKMLLDALNDEKHPSPHLRSLSIKNLQDVNLEHVVKSGEFASVLARLSELYLQMCTEYVHVKPNPWIKQPKLHMFFSELRSVWLEPTSHNLTHLTLFCDGYWGYTPKVDFRGLHFKNLRSLALGSWTFMNHWQLDWILSHGDTLYELSLDDCPILCLLKCSTEWEPLYGLDQSDFISLGSGSETWCEHFQYSARWHQYFDRFRTRLRHLCKFQFGFGPWNEHRAFEKIDDLGVALIERRYMIFDGTIEPSQWVECWEDGYYDAIWGLNNDGEGCQGEFRTPNIECRNRDAAALRSLMTEVTQRAWHSDK